MPSRNAIITNYGVGETAAKHALQVLIAEGLIEARPGSGCYVRRPPAAVFLEHDRPQFPGSPFGIEEVLAGGQNGAAHRLPARVDDAPRFPPLPRRLTWEHQTEQVMARLRSLPGSGPWGPAVIMTRYLMRADGDPVQLATSSEPAD